MSQSWAQRARSWLAAWLAAWSLAWPLAGALLVWPLAGCDLIDYDTDRGPSGRSVPVQVAEVPPVTGVGVGHNYGCVVDDTGDDAGGAWCWANNFHGNLGVGSTEHQWLPAPVQDLDDVAAITAGTEITCAVRTDGALYCWGAGGLVGDDTTTQRLTPVAVADLGAPGSVVQASAGARHACAVLTDGTVRCWGDSNGGRLGTPPIAGPRLVPIEVPGIGGALGGELAGAAMVASGAAHTCAALTDGTAWCWGQPVALGDGIGEAADGPVQVLAPGAIEHLSASGRHTCAVIADGTVWCWGDGRDGAFAELPDVLLAPVQIPGVTNAIAVATGQTHTCALHADGTVSCWGDGDAGQLGQGCFEDSATPVQVKDIAGAIAIDAGQRHTCAALADGTARCWGAHTRGELGDGDPAIP